MNITINRQRYLLSFLLLLIGSVLTMQAATSYTTSSVTLGGQPFKAIKVEKKESLYALSRSLNINYDLLSQWNQGIDGEVPKGYTLYVPDGIPADQKPALLPESTITYNVKYGDTLFAISNRYHTTVEDIISLNPQLRSSILAAGTTIKIPCNSAQQQMKQTTEMRRGIISFRMYQVKKDESWEGIASQLGSEVSLLREANPGVDFKRRAMLSVPVMGNVEFTTYEVVKDRRENTPEGTQAIFDSIKVNTPDSKLNVAVLLANPTSNKDINFSRGFLTAVKEFGEVSRKINIAFVNGSKSENDLLLDSAIHDAEIIFTTYDGFVPSYLADYVLRNNKMIINPFTVRDTLYRNNPSVINLLSSPQEFNAQASKYILDQYGDRYFVFVGDPLKANDQIANKIMNSLSTEDFDVVENLDAVEPHPAKSMVIYSFANAKNDIKDELTKAAAWIEKYPGVEAINMGRPSWIVYADAFATDMQRTHTMFPSRFYFADRDHEQQQFLKKYKEFFHADPVRSYPAYSVMGYDAAWYFLQPAADHKYLQMPFRLIRISGGGEYNSAAMMLRFQPGMPIEVLDIMPYQETSTVETENTTAE